MRCASARTERQQLAAAHAGRDGEPGNQIDRAPAQLVQDRLDLLRPEDFDFGRRHAGRVDGIGGILAQQSPLHGMAEGTMHDPVDMAHGARREAVLLAFPQKPGIELGEIDRL
jgi:hypothetical protein